MKYQLILLSAIFAVYTTALQAMEEIKQIAFSPENKYVLTGDKDNALLWDLTKNPPTSQRITTSPKAPIRSIAFSQSGNFVITKHPDDKNSVFLWDLRNESVSPRIVPVKSQEDMVEIKGILDAAEKAQQN